MASNLAKTANSATQEEIRAVAAKIKANTQNRLPPRQSRPQGSAIPTSISPAAQTFKTPTVHRRTISESSSDSVSVDNPFALELFEKHTNVREVVARAIPQRSESAKQRYVSKYFNLYVQQPKMRIREPLHELRFSTRAHEGLFRMVQKIPLTSASELEHHKELLERENIRQLCFVDMTRNNPCLEYQEEVVQTLKSRFDRWSGKLEKLPTYMLRAHELRQLSERKFLSLVKSSSSLKNNRLLNLPWVAAELVQESRIPSEKRVNVLWSYLKFDEDRLNKKYSCGKYSKFGLNNSLIEPVESVQSALNSYLIARRLNAEERCITPGAVRIDTSDDCVPAEDVVQQREERSPTLETIEPTLPARNDGTGTEIAIEGGEVLSVEKQPSTSGLAVIQEQEEFSSSLDNIEPTLPSRTDGTETDNAINGGYTLEYLTTHTNIYEVIVHGLMGNNNLQIPPESEVVLEIEEVFNYYRDIFTLHQLPDGLRLLTVEEQMHVMESGPYKWAVEIVRETQAIYNASLQQKPPSPSPSPPVVSPKRPHLPPRPISATHEPNRKQQKKDPVLLAAATKRPGQIHYNSEDSSLMGDTQEEGINLPNDDLLVNEEVQNQSIAFVSVPMAQQRRSTEQQSQFPALNAPQSQDSPLTDSLDFRPSVSSTQEQAHVPKVPITQTEPAAPTQANSQLSSETTTIPPFGHYDPHVFDGSSDGSECSTATVKEQQIHPTPSESGSVIPPFQVPFDQQTVSSSPLATVESTSQDADVKQEREEPLQQQPACDTSGYEDYVTFVPNPESVITIDDSAEEPSNDANTKNLVPTEAGQRPLNFIEFISRLENSLNGSDEGRRKLKIKAEEEISINPPRIGKYISLESQKTRPFASFPLAATKMNPNAAGPSSHLVFLTHIDVQSVRYSTNPIIWPQCNMVQHNPLTVNINPPRAGIFTVQVRDHHACQLLGLSAGGKGREALQAALEHTGKFRYGRKEPKKEYYRLTITEKVLQLFFDTVPPCPVGGSGLVLLLDSRSSLPADEDEGRLESFNYYTHAQGTNVGRPRSASTVNGCVHREESLALYLMPGIAAKMRMLRKNLQNSTVT